MLPEAEHGLVPGRLACAGSERLGAAAGCLLAARRCRRCLVSPQTRPVMTARPQRRCRPWLVSGVAEPSAAAFCMLEGCGGKYSPEA